MTLQYLYLNALPTHRQPQYVIITVHPAHAKHYEKMGFIKKWATWEYYGVRPAVTLVLDRYDEQQMKRLRRVLIKSFDYINEDLLNKLTHLWSRFEGTGDVFFLQKFEQFRHEIIRHLQEQDILFGDKKVMILPPEQTAVLMPDPPRSEYKYSDL